MIAVYLALDYFSGYDVGDHYDPSCGTIFRVVGGGDDRWCVYG